MLGWAGADFDNRGIYAPVIISGFINFTLARRVLCGKKPGKL
ncbi:hypothetical protein [Iodobacter ciconiae]|nr:hypothetical protein [Iodobacter ciconiae]